MLSRAFGEEVLDAVEVGHQEAPQRVGVAVGKRPRGNEQVVHQVDLADVEHLDAHPPRLRGHLGHQRRALDDVAIDGGHSLRRKADGNHLHVFHRVEPRPSEDHARDQVGLSAEVRHAHLLALELRQVIDVGGHAEAIVLRPHVAPEEHQVGAFTGGLQRGQHVLGGDEDVDSQKGLHAAGGGSVEVDGVEVETVLREEMLVPGDGGNDGARAEARVGDTDRTPFPIPRRPKRKSTPQGTPPPANSGIWRA